MAPTRAQLEAERWVVNNFLPKWFPGHVFDGEKVRLTWGGEFNFDAVSGDGSIVCLISTSVARTAGGKLGTAKIQKIRSDTLYLLNTVGVSRRALVFTEPSMRERFRREAANGRFPPESVIEVITAELPKDLQAKVVIARKAASDETSPHT
jgi:hypothetical protein